MSMPLILLVEDDDDARHIFSTILRHGGFEVKEASNGSPVVELTRLLKPAVVVMDLFMPEVNGWQAISLLKGDEETAGIPVIALTAHVFDGAEDRAMGAGFESYLTKPLDPRALVKEVRRVIVARHFSPFPAAGARAS